MPDVVVVGAGIIGAATAWELSRNGLRVEVVEAGVAGGGVTGSGMGQVVVLDDSPAQFALSSFSQRLWYELENELSPIVEFNCRGTIWLAENDDEIEIAKKKSERYVEGGVGAEVLDKQALLALEPRVADTVIGGFRVPSEPVVYPPGAVDWFLESARRDGISVTSGTVKEVSSGSVTLAGGGSIEAEWIVNATGPAANDILPHGVDCVPIKPRKGHLVITDKYPGFCSHELIELGYLTSAHGHDGSSVAFNLQPRGTGQLLLGSSRQYDSVNDDVETDVVDALIERALRYIPSFGELNIIRAWTGFRPATPDNLPLIGVPDSLPGVVMAAGHEGLGITTSLATARLVSDIIMGRDSDIDRTAFEPDRAVNA